MHPNMLERKYRTTEKKDAKLRNNVIFGKKIENPWNKIDVKLLNIRKDYLQCD